MQHRKFGSVDWSVSILGFGAMRLPVLADGKVDGPEAVRMMRRAIDGGVNYIDTAYIYHGGESETIVGKALADGYRAKVKVASKSPVWLIHEPGDFDRILDEQLSRMHVDQIDFYLLHGIGASAWGDVRKLDVLKRAEAARADGRIGHIGFSFHDRYECFQEIVDGYDGWEFCQIQYNYMDTENQAGVRGLRYAASKGLPVVIMEPLLGGRLSKPPPPIQKLISDSGVNRSPTELALRWLWNHPEVTTVLSGMSNMAQLEENLRLANASQANEMTETERALIVQARAGFRERMLIPCTQCDYCKPCPQGVAISRVFDLYNGGKMYEDVASSRYAYNTFVPEEERADRCASCGECESKCPQKIEIAEWMPKVHSVLGEGGDY